MQLKPGSISSLTNQIELLEGQKTRIFLANCAEFPNSLKVKNAPDSDDFRTRAMHFRFRLFIGYG